MPYKMQKITGFGLYVFVVVFLIAQYYISLDSMKINTFPKIDIEKTL